MTLLVSFCSGTEVVGSGNDYPALLYRLNAGSPAIHLDLVPANYTLKSTKKTRSEKDSQVSRRGPLGWFLDWLFGPLDRSSSFAKVPIVGQISEAEFVSRNSNGDAANGGYNVIAVSRNPSRSQMTRHAHTISISLLS